MTRFPIALLAALALALAAASGPAAAGDTLQRVNDFRVLTVGMSANQPPLTMVDKDGELMGFDVDLARTLAATMKARLEIKAMPFGELLDALQKNEIDMVLSGLAITPERTELVSFVGPYLLSGKSILTRDASLGDATSTGDFNRAGLRLLALDNSTSASFVQEVAPDATLVEVASYDDAVAMLLAGKADAMVADMPICVLTVMRHPDAGLSTLKQPLTVEPVGIAVSKDDPQFINLVDNYLRAYENTGLLNKLRRKWFEDDAWIAKLP